MNAQARQHYRDALTVVLTRIHARPTVRRFEAAHDHWRMLVGLPPTIIWNDGLAVFEQWDGSIQMARRGE